MHRLSVVIPFTTENATMAERMCDWIFHFSGQHGHAILVADPMVHEELKAKVKIAAEVAFSNVDLISASSARTPSQPAPHYWVNRMFIAAAEHVAKNCKWPFLWLEPECVPCTPEWMDMISEVYESQPKRYLGTHMMSGDVRFLSRVSVYPVSSINDFNSLGESDGPFEVSRPNLVLQKSGRTKLFQYINRDSDFDLSSVKPGTCVLVGDISGSAMEAIRGTIKTKKKTIPVRKSEATSNE